MPSPVPVRDAKRNLAGKGFRQDNRDHDRYTYYDAQGRKTGQYAYFSHGGAASREVGVSLMKRMRWESHLNRVQEVCDLLDCTMSEAEFILATQ